MCTCTCAYHNSSCLLSLSPVWLWHLVKPRDYRNGCNFCNCQWLLLANLRYLQITHPPGDQHKQKHTPGVFSSSPVEAEGGLRVVVFEPIGCDFLMWPFLFCSRYILPLFLSYISSFSANILVGESGRKRDQVSKKKKKKKKEKRPSFEEEQEEETGRRSECKISFFWWSRSWRPQFI